MSSSPLLKDARVVGGVALAVGLFAGLSLNSTFGRTTAPAADEGSLTWKETEAQKEGAQASWRTRRGSLPFPGELKTIPLEAGQVHELRAAKVKRIPPKEPEEGKNVEWRLKTPLKGNCTQDNFELVPIEKPSPGEGEILLKSLYVSVDPYLRSRLRASQVGDVTVSGTVLQVVELGKGNWPGKFAKGEVVLAYLPWRKYHVVKMDMPGLHKVPTDLPLSTALGVCGMPGQTAYFGLNRICKPKEGEVLLVTGAAGAVGSLVGQLGKLAGCFVIGTCGSPVKAKWLTEKLGFDAVLNYKDIQGHHGAEEALKKILDSAGKGGIDCFFENTGGHISDGAFRLLNKFARVAICGQIADYNYTDVPTGPRMLMHLIYKSALVQGFVVADYIKDANNLVEFNKAVRPLVASKQIKYRETVMEGFGNIPNAFSLLFVGGNIGKMIVKV